MATRTRQPTVKGQASGKGFGAKITIKNAPKIQAELRASGHRAANMQEIMNTAAVDMLTLIDDSFREQRDPGGKPWQELEDSTKRARLYDFLFGRNRGKKQKTLAKRSYGTLKRKRTQGEKAQETLRRSRKLSDKQTVKKMQYMGDMKALIDTGRLRKSWWSRAHSTGIKFGTNVSYASVHQMGGKDIPARPMAPIEYTGGQWRFMFRGPAGAYYDQLLFVINDYIQPPDIK
jgi:phage gpG-like protein